MKVTAFCGSPRSNGNTETVLREILKAAGEAGAETCLRKLNEMDIRPCQACSKCKETSEDFCALSDDMQTIYRDILDSDAIVIGSPVYMWQMSAQTKTMIDRLYATLLPGFESKTGSRRTVLVFTQAAPEGVFDTYVQSTAKMLSMLKLDVEAVIVAPATGESGSISENESVMNKAREAGALLVR